MNPLDAVLAFRIERTEKRIEKLDEWKVLVDDERSTVREQLKFMRVEMRELSKGFDSLRRTLIGFALTIAGTAVAVMMTVLVATGKI